MSKTDSQELILKMDEYIQELQELSIKDPEQAREKAAVSLMSMGLIDENYELLPPYNGTKVNEEDFTMGPGEIIYKKRR